jgi:serine/threonine-protein kinase
VPNGVAATISQTLAKAPADRYQTAEELGAELTAEYVTISAPTVTVTRRRPSGLLMAIAAAMSVAALALSAVIWGSRTSGNDEDDVPILAVLPAEQLGAAEDETLGEGLVLETHSRLTGLSGLKVISYNSTRQYKDSVVSNEDVGQALGANYLLRTTIQWQRPAGQTARVLVVAALVNASDDTEEWSDRYNEELSNIYVVQSSVAEQVVDALGVRLLEPERYSLTEQPTDDPAAWEYYLAGTAHLSRGFSPFVGTAVEQTQASRAAVSAYERAIEADSGFTAAWAKRAIAKYGIFMNERTAVALEAVREAAEQALELDPELADAKAALGLYYYRFGLGADLDRALQEMDAAVRQQPNNPFFLMYVGGIHRRLGDFGQAAEQFALAADLDPADLNLDREAALTYLMLRDYDQAERYLDRAEAIRPLAVWYLRRALLHLMRDADTAAARRAIEQAPTSVQFWDMVAHVQIQRNQGEAAVARVLYTPQERLEALDSVSVPTGFRILFWYRTKAELYRALGETEQARTYADSAIAVIRAELERGSLQVHRLNANECLAHVAAGRLELAKQVGEELLSQDPLAAEALYSPEYLEHVADALHDVGQVRRR